LFVEAELLLRETGQARREILGANHPDTLASLNDLASTYQAQGRREAEPLFSEVLQTRRQLLGLNHEDTIVSANGHAGEGRARHLPTVAPLGYRNAAGTDGKKIIEPDSASAPIISRMFEWYGTGTLSLKEAAQP
jgi:hypothetical protein